MTEETRKLFDAPWEVGVCEKGNPEFESVFVASKTGWLIGRDMEEETANRLARLPELYDALMGALEIICGIPGEDACDHCSNASLDLGGPCRIREWRELLRKVRNGE